jgi:hypothetical protein
VAHLERWARKMSVYDKAKLHFEGDYPKDLPITHAYVHIGFFLGWAIERGLAGTLLTEDFADELGQFRARKITAPRLLQITDGVLDDQMLSEEGNHFAADCYDDDYLAIYEAAFPRLKTLYHVDDTWENFEKLKSRLDRRYDVWKAGKK